MKDIIFNGVPWFDQNGNTVNAHGACIVREHDTYYLFGEYKTDDKNMYNGFSCYSSKNLAAPRCPSFPARFSVSLYS